MKSIFTFLFLAVTTYANAAPEPFIKCLSDSSHVKAIDIYMANFKDVPDIYSKKLPACAFDSVINGPLVMAVTYPAQGSTITRSNGAPLKFWTAAVVVDENKKATIYYQYSDFVVRSWTLSEPTPCTQGLFISDDRKVLEFQSNEPRLGIGQARINGEEISLACQSK